ncbi:MAG: hypothetical protein ITG02_01255 [Patulibacter sp.]|nr:hypothetical protein [Patulibacter sp.]
MEAAGQTTKRRPKPHVSLRLSPSIHQELQRRASEENRSMVQHVVELVKADANANKKDPAALSRPGS